jgi:hypothetical protein
MSRITRKIADESARRLNNILGLPVEPYALDEQSGRYVAQIGCIHICSQNGSNNIYQMDNEAGGCKGLAYGLTLRECNDFFNAMMVGIMLERNSKGN